MPSFTLVFGETASSPTLISRFWRVALVHEQGSICGGMQQQQRPVSVRHRAAAVPAL
eukprot:COSAG05_NODE_101_length_19100_cov_24.260144_20_plen_57_part_00